MTFLIKKQIFKYLLTLTFITIFLPANVLATELVQNGNFETGNLSNWTVVTNTNALASFSAYTGVGPLPNSGRNVLAPPEGNFAAITDQNGPSDHIIYQDITIPATSSSATFGAIIYLDSVAPFSKPVPDSLDFNTPLNQQMRVDIVDPTAPVNDLGAGVLLNIFQTNVGDPITLGYTNLTANLLPFAGHTIRIRIAIVDTENYFQGAIDDVSVYASIPNTPIPTLSEWTLILLILMLGFTGLRLNLNRKKL